MLVLTRNIGQKVVINGDLTIEVKDIRGKYVSIGFTGCAEKYNIMRQEAKNREIKKKKEE